MSSFRAKWLHPRALITIASLAFFFVYKRFCSFWSRQTTSSPRVVRLSLSSSSETRKKSARKNGDPSGEKPPSRGHFFLAVFFRVSLDGLSERGTSRSLRFRFILSVTPYWGHETCLKKKRNVVGPEPKKKIKATFLEGKKKPFANRDKGSCVVVPVLLRRLFLLVFLVAHKTTL